MTEPFLSIVIPAYNEALRITPSLERIAKFVESQGYVIEVIVVDDCSNDKTPEVLETFMRQRPNFRSIRNSRNLGKGGSVRRGMGEARGRYRLFSDADLSTPIEEVNGFFSFVEKDAKPSYDVVIGSRRLVNSRVVVRQPFLREVAGRVFSLCVRLLTLRGFLDTQCGFKLFTANAAEDVFHRLTIYGFGFDVESLFVAQQLGYRIKESPVAWYDSPNTKVRFWQDSVRMFFDLLRIRRNNWIGKYR